MDTYEVSQIWVFMGEGGSHPCALFSTKARAEEWINQFGVSGVLSGYPLDVSVYEWAKENNYFTPKYPTQSSAEFIQRFSSAYLEHYHYERGERKA